MAKNIKIQDQTYSNISQVKFIDATQSDQTGSTVYCEFLDTTVATPTVAASSADILSGKVAYVNGATVSGSIVVNGAPSITVNSTSPISLTPGYYSGGEIDVNAGDLGDGEYLLAGKTILGVTGQIPAGSLTITVSTTNSITVPTGYYNGTQHIALDSVTQENLVSGNIVSGHTILGVEGNYEVPTYTVTNISANKVLEGVSYYSAATSATATYVPSTTVGRILDYTIDGHPGEGESNYQFKAYPESGVIDPLNPTYIAINTQEKNGVHELVAFGGNTRPNMGKGFGVLFPSEIVNVLGLTSSDIARGKTVLGITGKYGPQISTPTTGVLQII